MAPSTQPFIVLIPAYNPDHTLVRVARELTAAGCPVVVVDDGSAPTSAPVFAELSQMPQVTVLRHVINLGKGAALKTGLNHAAVHHPEQKGVVCADADGQHALDDILNVGARLSEGVDALVLGVRTLRPDAPFRSRFGNALTRRIFNFLTGLRLIDTQTGLRGISMALIPDYLDLRVNQYDYEFEQLIRAKRNGHAIVQIPIASIYIDGNTGSHFNPLIDSARIYFVLFRFMLSSILAAVLDYVIFMVSFTATGNILASQYIARVLSGGVNYAVNRKRVFFSSTRVLNSLPKYVLLAMALAYCSYLLIELFEFAGVPVALGKPLAEGLLFLVSFGMQRSYVFARWKGDGEPDAS